MAGILAIELNDAGLVVADGEGWRPAGPGYALLDPEELLVGEAARRAARLRPRRLNDRFWMNLTAGALPDPHPRAGTPADLACAQLKDIRAREGEAEAVIFAVPGFYSREALGLLLGVAREADLPARGLVDAAVAAAVAPDPERDNRVADLHLHAFVLTELTGHGPVTRGEVQLSEALGLARLEQAWIGAVAEAFVRQTRFDPLHHAATEQTLFDRLPDWLATLAGSETEVQAELEHEGRTLSARLTRGQVVDVAAPVYERILRMVDAARGSRGALALQVTSRLAALPGLAERLAGLPDLVLTELPPGRAARGAVARAREIISEGEAVRFVTTLPLEGAQPAARDAGAPPADDRRPRPTHLLLGAVAWAIGETPLEVGTAPPAESRAVHIAGNTGGVSRRHCSVRLADGEARVTDHSRYGTWLNERRVEGEAVLKAGDVLRLGSPGTELRLIEAREREA